MGLMREAIAGRAACFAWILLIGSMGCLTTHAQDQPAKNVVIELNQNWQFRQTPAAGQNPVGDWMPATVPGDVHLDLLANKKIPDPFYRDNGSSLQWIEKAGWEYQVVFQATPALLARSHVDLVFNALDAVCQVTLNGVQILSANNMFRIWRIPARAHLHTGSNTLHVVFPSPIDAAAAAATSDPFRLSSKTEDKTYVRKAAYEYGWDWGPRFVTSGIWRPVELEAWDKVRIAEFAVRQRDVSREVAHLDAEVEIEAANDGPAKVNLSYDDNGRPVTIAVTMNVHAGMNVIDLPVEIRQPKLWYPAGYGDQPLYEFTAQVGIGSQAAASRTVRTGLRSIELRRQLDQSGRSFEFVVNGIPVFAKGANVIPFDSFPNRVTSAGQRQILEAARDANMNMIRVWGGGYYENDEFYEICDELGLMVWQDFMFGNDWQPGTYAFKQNIEAEAEDQVRRLRNHPSIVLWCGNNETEMAFNWGPRPSLPADVRLLIWQDYLTEFSGILPGVVARLDAETPYWPSSPSSDYEAVSPIFHSGDEHIWDVWHGLVPFSTYETHHPRFVTEFGFQSFPEMRTIEAFTEPADRSSIFTPVMLAHQKNADGNSIIQQYMQRDYPAPKDFASFLYVSQVLQAEGIKIGAEYFRRSRPETMGALFWQLNDCWPVASWSSIDYFGRWKALQYYARRFFTPVLVSPQLESGSVKIYIVSDKTASISARLRVRLMDFDGKVLLDESNAVDVAPLASKVYLNWPLKKLSDAGGADTSRVVVVADLMAGGSEISRNLLYLAPVKDIHLRQAQLRVESSGAKGIYTIRITSPVLARSVYLSFGDLDVKLSDNYFDLLPGETADIQAQSSATLDALRKQMAVISLRDAFGEEGRRTTITGVP